MRYVFEGPGPVVSPQGEIVHPGGVVEAAEEPVWSGPFRLLEEPEDAPAAAGPAPVSVPLKTAVAGIAPASPEGM